MGLCALTSSLRTPTELRRSGLTATFAVVRLEDQPALSCSSPPYLRPVHALVSARRDEAGNAAHYVSSGVQRNRLRRWRSRVHSVIFTAHKFIVNLCAVSVTFSELFALQSYAVHVIQVKVHLRSRLRLRLKLMSVMTSQGHICVQCVINGLQRKEI